MADAGQLCPDLEEGLKSEVCHDEGAATRESGEAQSVSPPSDGKP